MRGTIPDPDYGVAVNDLLDHGISFDDKTLAQALLNIYRKNFDISHEIEPNIFHATRDIFDNAAAEGIAQAVSDGVEVDDAFIKALKSNNDVFSAFRTHKMQNDIAAQLLTSDGKLKPFTKFVKDVSPYIDHKNRLWLQTEYNTAVLRAHQAAAWQQFENEKDVYPNLKWIESTSPDPGADHKVFWNTVRPVNDPFWDVHRPGDRWNCKCSLEQSDDPVTPVPDSTSKDKPSPGLENNPAKDKQLFSDKHPYFPKDCSSCPLSKNKLAALAHNLASGKNCSACKYAGICISDAEERCNNYNKSAMKSVVMDIVRAHKYANKRPKGIGKEIANKSFVTGVMHDSKKAFLNLYHHEYRADEIEAVLSFYSKPSKVRFVKESPLGEGKDMTNPKDIRNIAKKKARGVSHYNIYEFMTSNGKYRLKTEVNKKGYETPYFIYKEKEQ